MRRLILALTCLSLLVLSNAGPSTTLAQNVRRRPISAVCVPINVALASNGGTAVASSALAGYPASSTIDGDRTSNNWGSSGGWNDNTAGVFPDTLEVSFNASYSITQVDVYSGVGPALGVSDGIRTFKVQYWDGGSWVDLATVTATNTAHGTYTFGAVSTTKVRLYITDTGDSFYSRVIELEALGGC